MEDLKFQCCFCEKSVYEKIGALIVVDDNDKPENQQLLQQFFCHIPCFTNKLSTKTQYYTVLLNE